MHVYIFFAISILSGVWGLRNMSVRVPVAVRAGDRLRIACDYDLENAALYSVKFYQGDTEFYRFVPNESPPSRVFPLQNIQVDLSRSNSTVVTLDKMQRDMTGYYKCEVSADAPYFHTAEQSAPVICH
ncbi:uncharacterized protein LOC111049179 [Nilaparvata lugens]|uniref:uncharacterized protein LOC111049179 n=1 Tax=Nilaparvata lugens TaxID=108931 RepID=UPI00193D1038|nr:uncharacterized protein LOC111049179 [Nilaparvata lugens]